MPRASVPDELQREWRGLLAALPPERVTRRGGLQAGAAVRTVGPVALFAELEDVRLNWGALRAAPLTQLAGRYVTSAWTLKELLAHLASWAREMRQEVEMAACGEPFDYAIPYALSVLGPNQWNQAEVEKRAEKSLREILEEFERETQRLQELVLELPEETMAAESAFPLAPSGDPAALWRGNITQVVLMKCMHDHYHLGRIQQWLARQTESR